ncbi:MAG: hypothetical protein V3R99_02475 [Thermoguttaceae bacterium]
MSVGPLGGIAGSVAGSPLAQKHGSEVERAGQENNAQQRRIAADQKADSAAGIGEADGEDHETADRDADGRRLWEGAPDSKDAGEQDADEQGTPKSEEPEQRKSKDASGQSGNLLDLSG